MTYETFIHAVSNPGIASFLIAGLRQKLSPDYQFYAKESLTCTEVWCKTNFPIPDPVMNVLRGKGKLQ